MKEQVLALGSNTTLLEKLEKKLGEYAIKLIKAGSLNSISGSVLEGEYDAILLDAGSFDIDLETLLDRAEKAFPSVQVVLIIREKDRDIAEAAFRESRVFDYYLAHEADPEKIVRGILRTVEIRKVLRGMGVQKLPGQAHHERRSVNAATGIPDILKARDLTATCLSPASVPVLRSVFDNMKSPLIILDKELKIKAINRAALSYFNLEDKRGILEGPCYLALRSEEVPCSGCRILDAINTGRSLCIRKSAFQRANRWEEINIYPIPHRGETIGALVQINDISSVKEIETRFGQTEKLVSLGLLASSIAHEINGPNNLITFNIPVLRDYLTELLPVIEKYMVQPDEIMVMGRPYSEVKRDIFAILDSIQHGSERIKIIVSELSRFIRERDERQTRPVSVEEVINRALTVCGNKVRRAVRHFEIKLEESLPVIEVNAGDLEQVLINLLVNAAQSIDKENSWIRLSVKTRTAEERKELSIEIADNGCGIEPDVRNRIFEPFFTTKPVGQGTGLGLSICKTLMDYMGGKIEVESEPGVGSTFRIILPAK